MTMHDPAVEERLNMEECPWMWMGDEYMCPHCGGLSPNFYVHQLNHSVYPVHQGMCLTQWAARRYLLAALDQGRDTTKEEAKCRAVGIDPNQIRKEANQ